MIVFCLMMLAPPGDAAVISRACLQADRPGTSPAICQCIQASADRHLSKRDQNLAAQFFADPEYAQEIRQSDQRRHESFWQRYKAFNRTAARYCART